MIVEYFIMFDDVEHSCSSLTEAMQEAKLYNLDYVYARSDSGVITSLIVPKEA